ncbi:MAG: crotonase/enoyl-CoA hydratase family protein [Novosphingobium sp.]|nr:crotonase/enoyl-CoA hydratase family protein [Novosphingobium sp.]
MTATVRTETRDKVRVIFIVRPEVRNCVDPETSQAVDAALNEALSDDSVRAIVLAGQEQAFCTGMDLKHAARHGVHGVMIEERGFCGLTSRPPIEKPLIAAVNGFAFAGGFELALACDFIVAGENARFALPEVKRGLFAGAGGIIRLTRRVPGPTALEIIMTGEPVDARRALAFGIVNHVVPVEQTVDTAIALAQRITENAPISVRISKKLSLAALDLAYEEAVELSGELGREMLDSADRIEGVRAFAEGRKPNWTGK